MLDRIDTNIGQTIENIMKIKNIMLDSNVLILTDAAEVKRIQQQLIYVVYSVGTRDAFQTRGSSSAVIYRHWLKCLKVSWPSKSVCSLTMWSLVLYSIMFTLSNRFILFLV